jgi:hypothetical protein
MLTPEQRMSRADTLARQAGSAGARADQLSLVLVHLKRHQDVAATLALLTELHSSPFAHRSRSTPAQLRALEGSVRLALQRITDWNEAAFIIGWARRLVTFYGQGGSRPARP